MAKLLAMKDVAERVGYSESKVYKLIREGRFPAGRKMPTGGVRWLEEEVDEWITQTFGQAQEVHLASV
ncbi:helix-turn-helix transcriptional regulator [Halomonas caseinilytica]|uniref:Transcriptional regulator, AlpA family n=1 Tax=Halomonas caseinilytica TaxID=438744 RepID=A0A1M6T5W3_9GAMM|nr:AlpA family phage regulatory protein [Halomonas caseinilytica]SHK52442.1 transcriptional regulator, AlpA family [Halomonas caseinilytica]